MAFIRSPMLQVDLVLPLVGPQQVRAAQLGLEDGWTKVVLRPNQTA